MTYSRIFRFWAPLAATWIMMSVEGPLLAALIARLADPKFNLAAYGVAFSMALVIEAPVIMIMSASTALVRDQETLVMLRNFTWLLSLAVTFLMAVLLVPPLFRVFALSIVRLPEDVADLTWMALILLLPWPGAIGYRRLYQGVLIANHQTRFVAYGTVVRLFGMTVTGVLLYSLRLPGAWVGAAALSAGVVLEAIASRIMVRPALKQVSGKPSEPSRASLTYGYIARFYYPLALMSLLSLGAHPVVTVMVGQSRLAIESLAVLPVVNALVFLFRSLGLAYQEVGIALMGDRLEHYGALRNFAVFLMALTTVGIGLVAVTPLKEFWFVAVSGLSEDLSRWAVQAVQVLVIMPALSVLLAFQRALVVNLRITRTVSWATALEVSGIAFVLWISIHVFDVVGALAAALAMVCGRLSSNTFLWVAVRRALKSRRRMELGDVPASN